MLKLMILLAFLVGCSEIDGISGQLGSLPERAVCGWELQGPERLSELAAGECWLVTPSADAAVLAPGARPCEVASESGVWRPGEAIEVWSRVGGRAPEVTFEPVQCSD